MMRGAFSNPKLVNELVPQSVEQKGCVAWNGSHDALLPPYEAALTCGARGKFIVVAGRNYGARSSRDWAAKAPALLGIRAVVAESYERIHRSNLIGMGIYPFEFPAGLTRHDVCEDGSETIDIDLDTLKVGRTLVTLRVRKKNAADKQMNVVCRIDSASELEYLKHRGVLRYILAKALRAARGDPR